MLGNSYLYDPHDFSGIVEKMIVAVKSNAKIKRVRLYRTHGVKKAYPHEQPSRGTIEVLICEPVEGHPAGTVCLEYS
jgi:hypothetical protein